MYKVGVMMMGKEEPGVKSPTKVKEVVLEVEAKTKIENIFEYLIELNKIKNRNVSVSIEKGGDRINETSTISQVMKYTRPVNGVIKLYCYEDPEPSGNNSNVNVSTDKIMLKPSRHEIKNPEILFKPKEEKLTKSDAKEKQ